MEHDNLLLLQRWFEEVWGQRREETIDELMHPQVKAHGLAEEPVDREGFKAGWRFFFETFPDLRIRINSVTGNGNETAIYITVYGTHSGNGLGIKATGKPVVFDAMSFTTWQNGLIVEGWNVMDMAAVYRQVGAVFS